MRRIFGKYPVLEFIKGRAFDVKEVFVLSHTDDSVLSKIISKARNNNIPVKFKNRRFLNKLIGDKTHQGVIASVKLGIINDIDDLIESASGKKNSMFLLLDRIQDPNNFGSILRSAVCRGVDGIVILKNRSVGITPAVVKSSAGAYVYAKICEVVNLVNAISKLKDYGYYVVGADQNASKVYTELNYNGNIALVVGSEGYGLRRLVKENCDELVRIPTKGKVGTLNVAVAVGILLYGVRS